MPLSPLDYIQDLISKLGAYFVAKVLSESDQVKQELEKKRSK
jgi:hypothetical protein